MILLCFLVLWVTRIARTESNYIHLHALLHVRHIKKVVYIHSVKNAGREGAAYFPFVIGRCHFQRTSTSNGNQ